MSRLKYKRFQRTIFAARSKIIHLLVLSPIICMADGTESGGGGGVIDRGAQPAVLIDYLNIDLNFTDSIKLNEKEASRIYESRAPFILNSKNENVIRKENQAYDYALHIIQQWEDQKFDLMALMIHTAFHAPVNWSFVNDKLQAPNMSLPLGVMPTEKIEVAAYYLKSAREFSIQISLPIWNKMGLWSQAGLLVHESLRHLQIGWSNRFDEKTLQQATAVLMMCEPEGNLNYYLFYLIQNNSELAQTLYGDFDAVIKKYCKRTI